MPAKCYVTAADYAKYWGTAPAEEAPPRAAVHRDNSMTIEQALWILEHQIGPRVYGVKWVAVLRILEEFNP